MDTDLPVGSLFVMRYAGQSELWQTTDEGYATVQRKIKAGETIHRCVWKSNSLVSRASYVLRDGETAYETRQTPYQNVILTGHYHTFCGKVPAWLRSVG